MVLGAERDVLCPGVECAQQRYDDVPAMALSAARPGKRCVTR